MDVLESFDVLETSAIWDSIIMKKRNVKKIRRKERKREKERRRKREKERRRKREKKRRRKHQMAQLFQKGITENWMYPQQMKPSPRKLLSIQGRIPVKWTAIEAMSGRMEYSTKSDV